MMTPSTVKGYIHGLPDPMTNAPLLRDPDRWEEAISLHALYEHGGIWIHSDTYLRRSLTDWLPGRKEMAVFRYTDPAMKGILLDKRLIACQRHHPLIKQWRDEYMRLLAFSSVEAYLASIYTEAPLSTFTFPIDWTMALTLQDILLQRPYPMESIHLLPVETGPLQHERDARGDPKKAKFIGLHGSEPIVFLGV